MARSGRQGSRHRRCTRACAFVLLHAASGDSRGRRLSSARRMPSPPLCLAHSPCQSTGPPPLCLAHSPCQSTGPPCQVHNQAALPSRLACQAQLAGLGPASQGDGGREGVVWDAALPENSAGALNAKRPSTCPPTSRPNTSMQLARAKQVYKCTCSKEEGSQVAPIYRCVAAGRHNCGAHDRRPNHPLVTRPPTTPRRASATKHLPATTPRRGRPNPRPTTLHTTTAAHIPWGTGTKASVALALVVGV